MQDFDRVNFDLTAFNALEKLDGSEFYACTFRGIDFSLSPAKRLKFIECQFHQCNLSNLSVVGFSFRDVSFEECKLIGINWTNAITVADLTFKECKLDMSSFQRLHLKALKCVDSSAKNVDFSDAKLMKSQFSDSQLDGSTFTGADLSEADFRTARGYGIHPLHTKLKGARFAYPEASSLLAALGIKVEF